MAWLTAWQPLLEPTLPGYSVLLPVPGDLPFFTHLALDVMAGQDPTHMREILILPDAGSSEFPAFVGEVPVRVLPPHPLERLIQRTRGDGSTRHWLQMVRGLNAARAAHVLLHDCDLFLLKEDFLRRHYEAGAGQNRACVGVQKIGWDPWYAENGYHHVVTTWEALLEVDWLRSFPPSHLCCQEHCLDGRVHEFDTLLLAQCQTSPERVALHGHDSEFAHVGQVISEYRKFQASTGPYFDDYYRLFLIRLVADTYSPGSLTTLPELEELAAGIGHPQARPHFEAGSRHFKGLRKLLRKILVSRALPPQRLDGMRAILARFELLAATAPAAHAASGGGGR